MAGPTRDSDFSDYVAERQHALLRTAYVLTGDRHSAEDLLQTALARTYLSWGRVRDLGSADGYVRRIMVNEHTGWWRRAWRRREQSTDAVPEPRGSGTADAVARTDDRMAMWTAMQALPPRQRAAVVLRYYEDLSEAETAEVMGCSVGTVKSQTARGIAALRGRLAAEPATGGAR